MFFESIWLDDINLNKNILSVQKAYKAEYQKRYQFHAVAPHTYTKHDWARINFCYENIKNFGESVLDVGVGPGGLLNALHADDHFKEVTGIDIRHYRKLVKLHKDLDIRIMDATKMKFSDNSFDIAVCMEVLEHIDINSFHLALAELRRVASKRLFLTVPLCEREPLLPYHKLRFTPDDIKEFFPNGEYKILQPKRGLTIVVIIENLEK